MASSSRNMSSAVHEIQVTTSGHQVTLQINAPTLEALNHKDDCTLREMVKIPESEQEEPDDIEPAEDSESDRHVVEEEGPTEEIIQDGCPGDVHWPHAAVLLFLETYRLNQHLFMCPTLRKMEAWKKIAQQMTQKGCGYTAGACQKKWDNMRNRYKIIMDRKKNTGQGRKSWEYLSIMSELLHPDPVITPPIILSSETCMKRSDGDADWPHAAVLLFLETYRLNRHLFMCPTLKKMEVWRKIAQQMAQKGCSYTASACQKKWDNMRNRYKIIMDRNKNMGQTRKPWEYQTIMAELLDADTEIGFPLMISSETDMKRSDGDADWPHAAVLLFLETYRLHRHLFMCQTLKKMEVWRKIAQHMTEKGCSYTASACQKKWDNMKSRYKIITDRNKNKGKGRKSWEYLSIMSDLLHADVEITHPLTMSSEPSMTTNAPTSDEDDRISIRDIKMLTPQSASVPPETSDEDAQVPPPSKRKKIRKERQPPKWFKEYDQRNRAAIEKLIQVTEARNELLKELIKKL